MKTFPKPENLNGAELLDELKKAGIVTDRIYDFSNGNIGFETDDESTALAVVAVHKGTMIAPEPTVAEKLASVGLSVDDLKEALGL